MKTKTGKRSLPVLVIRILLIAVLCAGLGFMLLIGYLSLTEYNPAAGDHTDLTVSNVNSETLPDSGTIRVLSWNTGYGALGDNADFFMDGGKSVNTASRERVLKNISDIAEVIRQEDPDIVFLQEVDQNSMRSHHVNEVEMYVDLFPDMEASFAYNFRVPFIPYPIPPIGTVNSGVETLSKWHQTEAVREQLPCPFSWPVRVANLKRCLLISRIPAADGKELVLVNLHLEAYDSGEGKIAQTNQLKALLENEAAKGNYVIAGGDFNQIFSNVDSSAYPILEGMWLPGEIDISEFGSGLQFLMDSSVPTCRSLDRVYEGADKNHFQYYMIDGFIVSSNLDVKSLETLDEEFVSSDHNPVLLEVEIKG